MSSRLTSRLARSAGNGSLMRLAPVAMFYAGAASEAIAHAADSSRTTHGAAEAVDACRYFAALLVAALRGEPKSVLLSDGYAASVGALDDPPLARRIGEIASGSDRRATSRSLRTSVYVVHTLEAAIWASQASSTFKDGALLAVNLGEDADTTGAVYGQLAGAYYGANAIPRAWRDQLFEGDSIVDLATRLHFRAMAPRADRPAGQAPDTPWYALGRVTMSHMPRDRAALLGRETLHILRAGHYVSPSGADVDISTSRDCAVANTMEYPPGRDVLAWERRSHFLIG